MANKNDGTYYVHRNAGNKVFVKGGQFFIDQGGLEQEWGKNWTRVCADSLEHARSIGESTLPEVKYDWSIFSRNI